MECGINAWNGGYHERSASTAIDYLKTIICDMLTPQPSLQFANCCYAKQLKYRGFV